MRKEAEHPRDQESSQALSKSEHKEGPKERNSSASGPDQQGLKIHQEQWRSFEDPSDDAETNRGCEHISWF